MFVLQAGNYNPQSRARSEAGMAKRVAAPLEVAAERPAGRVSWLRHRPADLSRFWTRGGPEGTKAASEARSICWTLGTCGTIAQLAAWCGFCLCGGSFVR